jgi:NADPH2:quinone reductase
MRAIMAEKMGPPEDLAFAELAAPEPGPGEIAVGIKAAAVNYADLLVIEGKYQVRPPLPFVPGKEAAGVVRALGVGVDGIAVGDRVMVQVEHGAFAERVVAPASHCFAIPERMAFDEAAAIGIAYQTAYLALVDRAAVAAGETGLVTAASGSVGIAAVQLAKAMGCTVIAGLASMSKAEFVRENGADHVIDVSGEDVRESLRAQIEACVSGGVDVVIEMIGGDVFNGAIRTLAWCGRLVVVGFTGGDISVIKTNYALIKNITVTGVDRFGYLSHDPDAIRRAQAEIFRLFVDGRIHVTVQARFPLERVAEAFAVIRDRQIRGKVVLVMPDGD